MVMCVVLSCIFFFSNTLYVIYLPSIVHSHYNKQTPPTSCRTNDCNFPLPHSFPPSVSSASPLCSASYPVP